MTEAPFNCSLELPKSGLTLPLLLCIFFLLLALFLFFSYSILSLLRGVVSASNEAGDTAFDSPLLEPRPLNQSPMLYANF